MGYGYAETFLIVFLTHPGVILPTTSSAIGKAMPFIPPDFAAAIPTGGFPPIMSGLWQVLWAWILSLPGQRSAGFGWTMYALYIFFLFVYMYLFLGIRLRLGV